MAIVWSIVVKSIACIKEEMNMRHKRTYIWAYLDGKKLVEVIQAALDNNMMVADMKQTLIDENPGHEVTFKVVKS